MDKNEYRFFFLKKKQRIYSKLNHTDTLPINGWVEERMVELKEKKTLELGTKKIAAKKSKS